MVHAGNEAEADRVYWDVEHDGDFRGSHVLPGSIGRGGPPPAWAIDALLYRTRSQRGQAILLTVRIEIDNFDVLTFDVTGFPETLTERG